MQMGQQIRLTVFALIACAAFAQNGTSSSGETALKTQFVTVQSGTVQPDVKLEVLDWGGTGRNLVLLAGLGNTAHVFDSSFRICCLLSSTNFLAVRNFSAMTKICSIKTSEVTSEVVGLAGVLNFVPLGTRLSFLSGDGASVPASNCCSTACVLITTSIPL